MTDVMQCLPLDCVLPDCHVHGSLPALWHGCVEANVVYFVGLVLCQAFECFRFQNKRIYA